MMTGPRASAATLAAVFTWASATAAGTIDIDPGEQSRIQEFVVIVSDLDLTLPAFTDVLQWHVKHEGSIDRSVLYSWGLPVDTGGREVLVGNRASNYGLVRLVELSDLEQKLIRPGARWWDIGGVLNINVLVKDSPAVTAGLRALGWYARALPEAYVYPGNVKGVSMIMIGPDDLMLSFQERQSPPLTGWPEFDGATHIEVGYEMARDPAAWTAFYRDVVGFKVRELSTRGGREGPIGPNDFGLPHNATGLDMSTLGGAKPDDGEQLIGVRSFTQATGYDFSDRAGPPNLGIASVRFPLTDVDALAERIEKAGIGFAAERQIVNLAPYGLVKLLAVRTPGGGNQWIEFFQPGAQPLDRTEFAKLLEGGLSGRWQAFGSTTSGISEWHADGSARVTFGRGEATGSWALKGNAICTSWTTLRDGRESCAVYYHLGGRRYQSFTITGQPEGFSTFDEARPSPGSE